MDYDYAAMEIWEEYQKLISKECDDDYEVVPEQMNKLIDAYEFFAKLVKQCEQGTASIDDIQLLPRETSGGITAYFTLFCLFDEDMQKFANIMHDAVCLSIEPMADDMICISFTIPNIFRHK